MMGHLAVTGHRADRRSSWTQRKQSRRWLGVAVLDSGHGIKTTARSLGVSVSTLRRRLREAGEWPRLAILDRGVQNLPVPA